MSENGVMNVAHELMGAAARIWDWQQARGWTIARMIREYPDLGSDKTYSSIRKGRLEELDGEVWLARYMAVVALLEDRVEEEGAEEVYEELAAPRAVRRGMVDLFGAVGNARVMVLLGPSGIGKTTALRSVAQRYGQRVVWTEACDVWGDRPGALLGAIINALGGVPPVAGVQRMEEVVRLLGVSRRCVVIDEAHHLGPHCLGAIKALVNQTPGEFVLSAIPTLWTRLETGAYEEARQVTTNRLAERISLGLTEGDVARYLVRAVPELGEKVARQGARVVVPMAVRMGNYAFVRDVVRALRRLVEADYCSQGTGCNGVIKREGGIEVKLIAEAAAEAARRR